MRISNISFLIIVFSFSSALFTSGLPFLQEVPGSPFPINTSPPGGSDGPREVAFSPTSPFLAVANGQAGAGSISVFKILPNGALSEITSSPFTTASRPISVAYSPDGTQLAVCFGLASEVQFFSVNSTTGTLTFDFLVDFPVGDLGSLLDYDKTGKFVAVSIDDGTIRIINTETQSEIPGSPFPSVLGSGKAIRYSPDNKFLAQTASSLGSGAAIFQVDQVTGAPTLIQIVATGDIPHWIEYTTSGSHAAIANQFPDFSVSIFDVSITTGTFSNRVDTAVGEEPRAVAFSGDEKLLLVTNSQDDTLSVLDFNNETGALTNQKLIPTGAFPFSVKFSTTGRFVAVSNRDDNTISMYEVIKTEDPCSQTIIRKYEPVCLLSTTQS